MKILTLKQPWATLIAEGYKKYEFRTWKTKYRGECLIHAGKGIDRAAMKRFASLPLDYPKSRILAKVVITDCVALDAEKNREIGSQNPEIYGTIEDRTGYAWKLDQIEKVQSDVIVSGKLGLWDYP